MHVSTSTEVQLLESWLTILTETHKIHPSNGLAKTIIYYLNRIIYHDDVRLQPNKQCDYIAMRKFWLWKCQ